MRRSRQTNSECQQVAGADRVLYRAGHAPGPSLRRDCGVDFRNPFAVGVLGI